MGYKLSIRILATLAFTTALYGAAHLVFPAPTENKMLEKYSYGIKYDFSQKADMVFIGNSRIEQGVNTVPISNATGLSCYNFAIPLTTFQGDYYFERVLGKLDTSSCPVVVFGLSPSTVMYHDSLGDVENEDMNLYFQKPPFDRVKERYLYNYMSVFAPFNPKQIAYHMAGREYWYSFRKYHSDGWKQSADYPMQEFRTTKMFRKSYLRRKVNQNELNGLYEVMADWTERGIQVIAFNCPTGGHLEEFERDLGGFDEDQVARDVEAAGGKWIYIPDRNNFKSYDGSHLHYEGAQKLSEILADSISAHVNCP